MRFQLIIFRAIDLSDKYFRHFFAHVQVDYLIWETSIVDIQWSVHQQIFDRHTRIVRISDCTSYVFYTFTLTTANAKNERACRSQISDDLLILRLYFRTLDRLEFLRDICELDYYEFLVVCDDFCSVSRYLINCVCNTKSNIHFN